ncbi:trigger factor [Nakamurella silvestris]|nr:trigger factor [Nakamurella silvestris]
MKSTVEHLNPTRVKLTVEVPFDELGPNFDKAYKTLAGQVKVPGFRPGKVPARILDARVGRGAILSEVVNDAVPVKYGQAVSENAITPLGQPDIEVTKIEDGEVLSFTAEVDIRPEITLPEFGEIAVTVDNVEVTEADIDEQVDALRDRFAVTTVVERAAADGDLVTIDLRATIDGEELADATADGLSYRVGSGDLVDGIDEAITGLSAGESATFTTQLVAGDHADEDAEVTASVLTVSERVLPEVDEDFAQEASSFDTVEELRADLAEKIQRVKNQQQGAQARDKVLDALLEATDIPVPEGVAQAEFEGREHDIVHNLGHDEEALAAWLVEQGQTKEELDQELKAASAIAVRTQLLLDAMAEVTGVGVSQEEFTERVIFNAQRFGVSPDEYFKRLQEANQLGAVFADVRRGKALAHAVQLAKVTDEDGNVLDVAALFGFEAVDEEDFDDEDSTFVADDETEDDVIDAAEDSESDDADDSTEETKA